VSTVDDNDQMDPRLFWLLLIPAVLIAAILIRVFVLHVHDGNARSLSTRTVEVTVPAQVGRCAVPTADQLSQQSSAVQAEVTSADATTVQLRVTRVLAGPQYGVVTITLPAAGTTDTGLPTFTTGDSYLLAISSDDTLAGCGLSGKADGKLEDLYTQAFG
jgi:hypothetical protein